MWWTIKRLTACLFFSASLAFSSLSCQLHAVPVHPCSSFRNLLAVTSWTYLSRNFATLGPLTWQPPCGSLDLSFGGFSIYSLWTNNQALRVKSQRARTLSICSWFTVRLFRFSFAGSSPSRNTEKTWTLGWWRNPRMWCLMAEKRKWTRRPEDVQRLDARMRCKVNNDWYIFVLYSSSGSCLLEFNSSGSCIRFILFSLELFLVISLYSIRLLPSKGMLDLETTARVLNGKGWRFTRVSMEQEHAFEYENDWQESREWRLTV